MTLAQQFVIIRQLQKLYPDYAVGLKVSVDSMIYLDETLETTVYSLVIHRNGDYLVNERFESFATLLTFLENTPKKSPLEIIKEAKLQVKAYEQKQNTKPRWTE